MEQAGSPAPSEADRRIRRVWFFPAGVLLLYGVRFLFWPDRAMVAFRACAKVGLSLVVPLAFVVAVLFLFNVFVRPSQVAGLLGKRAGARAIVLSLVAGIISAGPIYAWYPLLKDLKEQGAADGPIAVFLYNRAVKPFLLPVMIGCFGWRYVLVLTVLMMLASIVLGHAMEITVRDG